MSNALQLTLTFKKSIWNTPSEYKDLSNATEIAIDLETRDDGINEKLGAGWALGKGYSVIISINIYIVSSTIIIYIEIKSVIITLNNPI